MILLTFRILAVVIQNLKSLAYLLNWTHFSYLYHFDHVSYNALLNRFWSQKGGGREERERERNVSIINKEEQTIYRKISSLLDSTSVYISP